MNRLSRELFGFFVLVGVLAVSSVSSVQAFAFPGQGSPAGGPPSVADCVERTGKTESECQEMMEKMKSGERPKMNTADCVERTGKTESECKEMEERMKDGPPKDGSQSPMSKEQTRGQDGSKMSGTGAGVMKDTSLGVPVSGRAEQQKAERARMYEHLERRTEKFIGYLKDEGVNTDAASSSFVTFKSKAESALVAFDTYIAAVKSWENDRSNSNASAVATAKAGVRAAAAEAKAYYRETLLPILRASVDSVHE